MVNPIAQPRLPGSAPAPVPGMYLAPQISEDDEPDCFDDEDIAPQVLAAPVTWWEPQMISDDLITVEGMGFHGYQKESLANALNAFFIEEVRRARLICPTGCGKTITFNGLAKILTQMNFRVLILVHRNDLLRQADEKLQKFFGLVPLIEQGNSRALPHYDGSRIVLASVQSMHKDRVRQWPRDSFDFIINDECHHIAFQPAAERNHWSRVLQWFHTAKCFGVTATPGKTKKIKGEARYINIPGWDRDIEPIKTLQAIEGGYLAPLIFKQIKTDIDLRAVGHVFGEDSDFKQTELDAVIYRSTNRLATSIKENIGAMPTMAFTPLVASAEALSKALNDIGVKAAFVSGETKDPKALYDAHENGEFQVLVNCNKCTEGFDAPYLECLVLAKPTQSINAYRQMVGRVTRTCEKTGKKRALVLDFAYITNNLPLAGPAEYLREKLSGESEEDANAILAAANELFKADGERDLFDALEAARLTVEEQKEKERVKAEIAAREAARREALRLKNREERFRYEVTTLDPFAVNLLGIPENQMQNWNKGEPITQGQANYIQRLSKGKIKTEGLTKRAASGIIGQLKSDMDNGRASYAQREVLTRRLGERNLSAQDARAMSFEAASEYITAHKTW